MPLATSPPADRFAPSRSFRSVRFARFESSRPRRNDKAFDVAWHRILNATLAAPQDKYFSKASTVGSTSGVELFTAVAERPRTDHGAKRRQRRSANRQIRSELKTAIRKVESADCAQARLIGLVADSRSKVTSHQEEIHDLKLRNAELQAKCDTLQAAIERQAWDTATAEERHRIELQAASRQFAGSADDTFASFQDLVRAAVKTSKEESDRLSRELHLSRELAERYRRERNDAQEEVESLKADREHDCDLARRAANRAETRLRDEIDSLRKDATIAKALSDRLRTERDFAREQSVIQRGQVKRLERAAELAAKSRDTELQDLRLQLRSRFPGLH